LGVLESWLEGRKWLVGKKMSVVDVPFLSWYEEAFMVDVDISGEYRSIQSVRRGSKP